MLQVQRIRDHKGSLHQSLEKKEVWMQTPVINQVLEADDNRRATQAKTR